MFGSVDFTPLVGVVDLFLGHKIKKRRQVTSNHLLSLNFLEKTENSRFHLCISLSEIIFHFLP